MADDSPNNIVPLLRVLPDAEPMGIVERRLREAADGARDMDADTLLCIFAKDGKTHTYYVSSDAWRILGMLDVIRSEIIAKHLGNSES